MSKKAVAVLTAMVFVVSTTGCMTWKRQEILTSADHPGPNRRILSVVLRSGEVLQFSRTNPARVEGNRVVGTPTTLRERDVELEAPFPAIQKRSDGTVSEITDAKGQVWSVRKVLKEQPNGMTVRVAERIGPVAIPLSEVRQVEIKDSAPGSTLLAILGLAGAVYLGWAAYSIKNH